jgi:hypothetical protein
MTKARAAPIAIALPVAIIIYKKNSVPRNSTKYLLNVILLYNKIIK